ncbi:hypothetical protein WMY93_034290 [Mugilogobius chulae]|uniref:separase n=1 Tax=Mugilogobius chulae TaxID=88201 RepID=A0AAW0MIC3_9GOBI
MPEMKTEPKVVPPTPSAKKDAAAKAKDGVKSEIVNKAKELKKPKIVKARADSSSSSSRVKTPIPMTPVMPSFGSESPKTVSKFQVYEELSPEPTQPVPAAPKRTRRLRFKVDFSDESDSEANPQTTKKEASKPRSTRKSVHSTKTPSTPATPAVEKTPKTPKTPTTAKPRPETRKKSTASISHITSSEDEEPARRGRSKRATRGVKVSGEETDAPDKMRTIDEETLEVLDMSIEELRASDVENEEGTAMDTDFEVLRRDLAFGLGKGDLFELKHRGHPAEGAQTQLPHDNFKPDNLSLDEAKSLLSSAWLILQHCPSPSVFSSVCALLALAIGQEDPQTTAMLHAQSLGISSRHRTIRHLANSLRKLRKNSNELQDKMESLTLNDPGPDELRSSAAQRLTQLETSSLFQPQTVRISLKNTGNTLCSSFNIYLQLTNAVLKYPCSSVLFHAHLNTLKVFLMLFFFFSSLPLSLLPSPLFPLPSSPLVLRSVVCVLSAVGLKPGQMGNSLLLSRIEKDRAPVTVHIPSPDGRSASCRITCPLSRMVQEIDSIQVEQKVVSSVAEKAKWWEGRRALDSRVEELLKQMEEMLTCWKSLLLPSSSDSELETQVQKLHTALSTKGAELNKEMLKAVLSAAPVLSEDDLRTFAFGVFLTGTQTHLQKLPWESISVLKSRSVSRMPSLHSLIGLSIDKEIIPRSVLKQGVDTKKVFYVLDPDGNLENSKDRFKESFSSKTDWDGVCGVAPDSAKLMEAVSSKDLYIYVGHGAGARFLDSQAVLKQQMRSASLLFGCSSAALAVRGEQEGQGIVLYYLIAGCPFVLGTCGT